MQVFMSWSGPRSHRIAMDFNKWLPHVCQHLRPWISSEDNAKGADWAESIRASLFNSRGVGLFFLTEAALKSQWFLFEAGCIAMLEHKRVCVIVVEDSVGERLKPPLSQFQRTRLEKADVFTLIKDLNALAGHPTAVDILDKAFDGVWDDFEQSIKASLAATANVDNEPSAPTAEALLNEMSEALVVSKLG